MSLFTKYHTPVPTRMGRVAIIAKAAEFRERMKPSRNELDLPMAFRISTVLHNLDIVERGLNFANGRTALTMRIDGRDGDGKLIGYSYVSGLLSGARHAMNNAINIGHFALHYEPLFENGTFGNEDGLMARAGARTDQWTEDEVQADIEAMYFALHFMAPLDLVKKAYDAGGVSGVIEDLRIPDYAARRQLKTLGIEVPQAA